MDIKKTLEKIAEHESIAQEHKAKEIMAASYRRSHENKVEELKQQILTFYQQNGVTKDTVDMGIVNFVINVNEGRESIDCPNIDSVPEAFVRVSRAVDKKLVAEHFKTNLPNWATLKRGEPYLTIKSVRK